LRFYVVALLFVIFDVEMAFFFPWAVMFGKATALTDPKLPPAERAAIVSALPPSDFVKPTSTDALQQQFESDPELVQESVAAASSLAWVAFVDILFFFGVLLVGFAYLWKRGDLDWVRSTAAQKATDRGLALSALPREQLMVLTKD
jgi:NADH-quinone oxidoreductase subunit A